MENSNPKDIKLNAIDMLKYTMSAGIIYALAAVMQLLQPENMFLATIITIFNLCAPFAAVYLCMSRFRDTFMGGFVSYGTAFRFGLSMITWGALLFGGIHFIIKSYIAPDDIELMKNTMENLVANAGQLSDGEMKVFSANLDEILTPYYISMATVVSKMIGGTFVSLIIALFVKRKRPEII